MAKADDDGCEHQGLGNGIGMGQKSANATRLKHWRRIDPQTAHAEDEEIDGIGEQRQADNHLIGARPEQKPDAGSGENADACGENQFHYVFSFAASFAALIWARGARTDWWASAIRISTVAPSTSEKTPRSNRIALASGILPMTGSDTYWEYEVRNG